RLRIDRLVEVGDLAFGHVAFPRLDVAPNAELLEQRRSARGHLAIIVLAGLGHRDQKTFNIGHAASPSDSCWGWLAANTASWSASARRNAGRASPRCT